MFGLQIGVGLGAKHHCFCLGENLGCAPQWGLCVPVEPQERPKSHIRPRLHSKIMQGLWLCLKWGGRMASWPLRSSKLLTVFHCWVRSQAGLLLGGASSYIWWLHGARDCVPQLGRVTVWVLSSDRATRYVPWLCGVMAGLHRLCSAIGQGHNLRSAGEQYHRPDSKAVQDHCACSLLMWGQRLYLTVG